MARSKQTAMLKSDSSAYGGDLLTTRRARSRARPLSTRDTMHVVLRSTKAKGAMSFLRRQHKANVGRILSKFSNRYGIKILSMANVGNHIHIHLKLSNRFTFAPFIRAVTGAIAMAVSGRSRWSLTSAGDVADRFWDRRPFSRIVKSFKAYRLLQDYLRVNQLEGAGHSRAQARSAIASEKLRAASFEEFDE